MQVLPAFPDAEEVAMALLDPAVAPTVLSLPATIVPPLIRANRVGGGDNRITDTARVEVLCFGATHEAGRDLAELARQTILAAGATQVAGATIDDTFTDTAPQKIPYSQSYHTFRAVYRLQFRR